jgi:nucleoside 2-deoxyribosyltransferase
MAGLSYEAANDWRAKATEELAKAGIAAYSPMRDKSFLVGQTIDSTVGAYDHPLATSRAIMTRDRNDTVSADAVLVNYSGFDGVSIGTVMEQVFAYEHNIPVVVIASRDYAALKHPMLIETVDFWAETLEDGIAYIKTIVLPEGMKREA